MVYGELLKDYRKDYANWEDNYPKSLRQALDVMRQLKPSKRTRDINWNNHNDKSKPQNGNGNQD